MKFVKVESSTILNYLHLTMLIKNHSLRHILACLTHVVLHCLSYSHSMVPYWCCLLQLVLCDWYGYIIHCDVHDC